MYKTESNCYSPICFYIVTKGSFRSLLFPACSVFPSVVLPCQKRKELLIYLTVMQYNQMLTFPIWCNNKDWVPKSFHGPGLIEVWLLYLNSFDSIPQSFSNILQDIQLNNYRVFSYSRK